MATLDFYINTKFGIDPAASLVISDTNTRPYSFTPKFVLGDTYSIRVYLVDGNGLFDTASGAGSYSIKVGLGTKGAIPTGGTFTLSDGTYTTSALAYNASAATVQAALNALNSGAGPFSDQVTVTSAAQGIYKITFNSVGSHANLTAVATSLTPTSGIVVSQEQDGTGSVVEIQTVKLAQQPAVLQDTFSGITNGWSGTLSFNTYSVMAALGDASSVDLTLEVELTDPSGNRRTLYNGTATIVDEVIDAASLTPQPQVSYYTAVESNTRFIPNRTDITGLTGGGSTNLDGIATVSGATPVGQMLMIRVSGAFYCYELVTGTDAESSPSVIRPDDYAGTTNEVVWKVRTPYLKNASVAGVGTDYTMTNSYARATFGTTSLQAALPEAGTYEVVATLEIVNGATASDVYTCKFYDATAAADIASSERKIDHLPASKTGQMTLRNYITVTGASNIQVYGVNATAARGTMQSTRSSIGYVKIG